MIMDLFYYIITILKKTDSNDHAAILYHEICHVQNEDYKVNKETFKIEDRMNEPQEEIKQIILQILKNDFPDSSDEEIQFYYDDFFNIYNIRK